VASLAATIDHFAERVAPALVSASGLAAVRELCSELPAGLTNCVFLERWLTGDPSASDLIIRVLPGTASILAAAPPGLTIARELRAQAAWQRLAGFAREWQREGSPLGRGIEALWLEFDRSPGGPTAVDRVPRVFIDFHREVYARAGVEARLSLALSALRPLVDELPVAIAEGFRACLTGLPKGACVPYVGLSLDPALRSLRVCVLGLRTVDIPRYLAALGWAGDGADLSSGLLEGLAHARGDAERSVSILHLDLGPCVAPRIGLEYGLQRASQIQGRVHETGFIDYLVERGWCDGATGAALLAWPGSSAGLMPHEVWYSRLVRRLNHVKVTYATGQAVQVKAYICFFHTRLRDAIPAAAHLLGYPVRYPGELLGPSAPGAASSARG
jgi:hypothetical protein